MADATQYITPVDDYAFLYKSAFGVDLLERSTGGEMSGDDAAEIVAGAGEFAAAVLAPLLRIGDSEGAKLVDGIVTLPAGYAEAYREVVNAGWITAEAPATAGGDGLPESIRAALGEIWNGSNPAFALCWLLSQGQMHALDAFASEELRETYLSKLVSGEWTGTMNLTEPQAGTDLGAISTMATPNVDGSYSIKGQKIFITWGDHEVAENIVHLVLARTPDAPEGAKGLSLFVAPKYMVNADGSLGERNKVATVSLEHKLGIHASPTAVLAYEGATGYLVGEINGGLAGMFVMMNSARIAMGYQATGISDRAYQRAVAYAGERLQGPVLDRPAGTPIAEHPDVRRLLLSMQSKVFAFRALSVYVSDLFDRAEADGTGEMGEFFVPILKGWTTEDALTVTSDAIQVHGGMGFIEETGVAQHYRDARIMPIYEGTTAIQSNDLIGRKTIRNKGAVAEQFFTNVLATASELGGSADATYQRAGERLQRAVEAARRATADLISFAGDQRSAYAVSVPYLMLLGTLAGGWMHGLAALNSDGDAERLLLADFYGAHHLPRVYALAETIASGEIA